MNLKERAKKLKKDIPAVYIALKDRETPVIARILAGVTVGYALSPVDLRGIRVNGSNSYHDRHSWKVLLPENE